MKAEFFLRLLKNKLAIFLIIILFSFIGYRLSTNIPQSIFPNVFFPRIQVTIENGYTPIKQMLFQVTKSSEEKLKSVQGIEKVISNTSVGSTEINLYFNWNTDPNLAYQLVQARMAELKNEIPAEAKITIIQATPSRYPVAIYSIASDTKQRTYLTDSLFYKIKPYLLSVSGIYDVEIIAPEWEEYQIIFNPNKLKNMGLQIDNLVNTIKSQDNINFLGLIKDFNKQYVLSLNQKADSINQILDIKIPVGDKYVSLSDIASIIKDKEPVTKISASSGNKYSVVFNILRQPNANSIDVARDIQAKIDELNKQLIKENIQIKKYYDETEFIERSVKGVRDAVILGTIITTIIVLMFLRKIRLSFFLLFSVPTVFMITIIGLKLFKFDFNIFTLGGMAASVGGLIDHIIIVIESIEKHYEKSKDKLEGVIEGSKDIIPIMTVATLVSVLLFIPLLLVSGVVGIFFKQLTFVIISSYIISQILAIFFTPIIAYIALPDKQKEKKEDLFDKFVDFCVGILRKLLRFSWLSVPLVIIIIFGNFYLYKNIPYTFLPKWDEGGVVVDVTLPSGTSLEKSSEEFLRIGKILDTVPDVKNWTVRVGASLGSVSAQPNVGDFLVVFNTNRTRSGFDIKDEISKKINSKFANFEEFDLPQVLEDRLADILGEETPITVILFGSDPDHLIDWGDKLKEQLRKSSILEEVNLQTSYASPTINIRLKPQAEALYGIDVNMLTQQVNSLYFGELAGNIIKGEKVIGLRVILKTPKDDPINYLQKNMKIYSPKSQGYIPLSYVADLSFLDQTPEINHYNLSSVATITLRFKGDNMAAAVDEVKKGIQDVKMPQDIVPEISGFYKEQQKSFNEMISVIIFAIVIIFISLLLEFNSLQITISIVIGLIMTLFGVFVALTFTGKPLDITGFMGMLIVLSIVINNNILIFHGFIKNADKTHNLEDNILMAVKERFRPIIMTMFSNIFSLIPIAMTIGDGTEIIQNMAISIMGGLSMAIFSSLCIIPMLYVFMKKIF